MTKRKKGSVIRRWNQCDRNTKTRMAAEFFKSMRDNKLQGDWWQFLDKKLSTSTQKTLSP